MTAEFFEVLKIQINLLRNNRNFVNCNVICRKSGFLAHKIILCAASEYFENYFKSRNTSSLDLNFMDAQTFKTVLDFIYGVPDLSNIPMEVLMDAFEKLKMPFFGKKDLHDISQDLNRMKNKGNKQIEWMLSKMKQMQQNSFLVDGRLMCENKEFLVHKVILAAFSGYFRNGFDKSSDLLLSVNWINSKILDNTLIFLYEGRLEVTLDRDLIDLMEVSVVLEIPLLYEASLKQLLNSISQSSQSTALEVLNTDFIKRTHLIYLSLMNESSETRESFVRLLKAFIFILRCSAVFSVKYEVMVCLVLLWANENHLQISDLNYILKSIDFFKISNSHFQKFLNEIKPKVTSQFHIAVILVFHKHLVTRRTSELSEIDESCDKDKELLVWKETNLSIETLKTHLEEYMRSEENKQLQDTEKKPETLSLKMALNSKRKRFFCYDCCSFNGLLQFDTFRKEWIKENNMFLVNCFARANHSAICNFSNSVYFFGGKNSEGDVINQCYLLDLQKNKFLELPPMIEKRRQARAFKLFDFIYVIGGINGENEYIWSNERYNITSKSWESIAKIPYDSIPERPVHYCPSYPAVTTLGNDLYFFGKGNVLLFNSKTNKWKEIAKCIHPYPEAITEGKGKIIFMGQNRIHSFDVTTEFWDTFEETIDLKCFNDMINMSDSDELQLLIVNFENTFLYNGCYLKTLPPVPFCFPKLITIVT